MGGPRGQRAQAGLRGAGDGGVRPAQRGDRRQVAELAGGGGGEGRGGRRPEGRGVARRLPGVRRQAAADPAVGGRAGRRMPLPEINLVVDAYNAISVRHGLPIGGEDLRRYEGTARLVRAVGTSRSRSSRRASRRSTIRRSARWSGGTTGGSPAAGGTGGSASGPGSPRRRRTRCSCWSGSRPCPWRSWTGGRRTRQDAGGYHPGYPRRVPARRLTRLTRTEVAPHHRRVSAGDRFRRC